MTVAEMLERISAYELTEWEAYERVYGPLDDVYAQNKLADLHELLQAILLSLSADEDGKGTVKRQPRPHEVYEALVEAQAQEDMTDEEREEQKRDNVLAFVNTVK